jgi:hypothetical protein
MQHKIKSLFIVCLIASISFITSCSKDDDGPAGSPIVGTWTYNKVDLNFTVNNQPFTTFLVSTGEFTAPEAAAYEAFFKTLILNEVDLAGSSATFNADGTCRFVDGGTTETGTYVLSNNNTELSVTIDGDTQVFQVKELTNNRMVLSFSEEELVDLDDNGVDETLKIAFDFTLIK